MAENVYQQYVTDTGIIVPDTESVKTQVQNEFKNALGQDLSLEDSTPQGRLIDAETIARKSVVTNNAQIANQLNPNTAGGIFLDALCAITGTSRKIATYTEVLVTITGVAGTVVPAGVQAKTTVGDVFENVNSFTIPLGGTGTTYFKAIESGPVACAVGTLTQIVTAVLGWETINNPIAATIGTDTESDADLRLRRNMELYKGNALLASIAAAVESVSGVLSVYVDENDTNATKTVDGVSLDPHSLYVVVDGGANADIAKAIWEHKSLGCGYTGTQTVTVYGPYNVPYTVKFNRPTYQAITMSVSVNAPTSINVSDVQAQVKEAVMEWANGDIEGIDGLKLGVDVSAFEAAAAISQQIPSIFVTNVQIALSGDELGTATLPMKVFEKATIAASDITVTVA